MYISKYFLAINYWKFYTLEPSTFMYFRFVLTVQMLPMQVIVKTIFI